MKRISGPAVIRGGPLVCIRLGTIGAVIKVSAECRRCDVNCNHKNRRSRRRGEPRDSLLATDYCSCIHFHCSLLPRSNATLGTIRKRFSPQYGFIVVLLPSRRGRTPK